MALKLIHQFNIYVLHNTLEKLFVITALSTFFTWLSAMSTQLVTVGVHNTLEITVNTERKLPAMGIQLITIL